MTWHLFLCSQKGELENELPWSWLDLGEGGRSGEGRALNVSLPTAGCAPGERLDGPREVHGGGVQQRAAGHRGEHPAGSGLLQ